MSFNTTTDNYIQHSIKHHDHQHIQPLLSPDNISCYPFGALLISNDIANNVYLSSSILAGILTFLTVTLNGLVLMALFWLRLYKKPANLLLIMLNVVDILAGVGSLPLYSIYMRGLMRGQLDCFIGKVLMVTGYSLTICSTITIAFITFHLYQAILNPFQYHQHAQHKYRFVLLLSFCWIATLIFVFIFVFVLQEYWKYFKMVTGLIFLLLYIGLCISHRKIYKGTGVIKWSGNTEQPKQVIVTNRRLLKMVTTVLISFGICYLPFVVFAFYITIFGLTPYVRSVYAPWGELTTMCNYALNPCIYCFRLKSVRKTIINILKFRLWKDRKRRKISIAKLQTGLPLNTVNLSILTTSITTLSSIRFNHESKYKHDVSSTQQTLCKALTQSNSSTSTSNSNHLKKKRDEEKGLDECYRQQANVLKGARFLFFP